MKPTKVYAILNKAPLARDVKGVYHSSTHEFKAHHQARCNGVEIVDEVLMVEMIRKGQYKDALSDANNSIFIKTLKELKQRVSK